MKIVPKPSDAGMLDVLTSLSVPGGLQENVWGITGIWGTYKIIAVIIFFGNGIFLDFK